jgi:hypothetical protein
MSQIVKKISVSPVLQMQCQNNRDIGARIYSIDVRGKTRHSSAFLRTHIAKFIRVKLFTEPTREAQNYCIILNGYFKTEKFVERSWYQSPIASSRERLAILLF